MKTTGLKTHNFTIEPGKSEDAAAIVELYAAVAAIEGGLARTAEEISREYVEYFLRNSLQSGIIVVARNNDNGKIVGEIHGYALGPKVFAHVLGELTIAVRPDYQGFGIGKALFTRFMDTVKENRPDITRVELIARESNQKAIEFYKKIGFEIEGRLRNRILSVGGFEDDIPMAWYREEK